MSHNIKDEQRFYAVFQPSAYSEGVEPYYPLQPRLWNSPVYGRKMPELEPYQGITDILADERSDEEKLGLEIGSMIGFLAGTAANYSVPWLKNKFFLSRWFFVLSTSSLGALTGAYIGKRLGEDEE